MIIAKIVIVFTWKICAHVFRQKYERFYISFVKRNLTFSHAKSTGAVARPNFKSAAVGLPIVSAVETKSSISSTS